MSTQLLLEDFIGLMREEGELDVFLPTLLAAMGHVIFYRSQKGSRQYGVDIATIGQDDDKKKKVFLWLVKCGDIDRTEWNSGNQAVRPSIDDAETYVASHIPPHLKQLPFKLVIVTNGDFKQSIALTIANHLSTWSSRTHGETDMIGRSGLAKLTEKHLLSEYILPSKLQTLFRRMLANVNSPEISVTAGRALVDELLTQAFQTAKSDRAKTKQLMVALRGVRTSLVVLHVWAKREENLSASYEIAEYAVLAVWGKLHGKLKEKDKQVTTEFGALLAQLAIAGESLHNKLLPYYVTDSAFAHTLGNSILVNERVFEEIGRLGLMGYMSAVYAAQSGGSAFAIHADHCAARVQALLESHVCSMSPIVDHQANDIFFGLLCLFAGRRSEVAKNWLFHIVDRLRIVVKMPKNLPLNASFDELVAFSYDFAEPDEDSTGSSTMFPMLALWAAALGMEKVYEAIRLDVAAKLPNTTLNMWTPDGKFEDLIADYAGLFTNGIGDTYQSLPETCDEFVKLVMKQDENAPAMETFSWYELRMPYIPLLAARHWSLQIPRHLMANLAIEFAKHCSS